MSYTPPHRRLRSAGRVQEDPDLSPERVHWDGSRALRESPEGDVGSPTDQHSNPASPQHSEPPRSSGEPGFTALRAGSPPSVSRSVGESGFSSTPFGRDMVTGPDRYLPIPPPSEGQRVPPHNAPGPAWPVGADSAPGPVRPVGADPVVENPRSLFENTPIDSTPPPMALVVASTKGCMLGMSGSAAWRLHHRISTAPASH